MRRRRAEIKKIEPDSVYDSVLVSKLINRLMKNGKKELARKAVYEALEQVKQITKERNPLAILETAIENIKPKEEIRKRRVGGQNYAIPYETTERRSTSKAVRWLVIHSESREDKSKNIAEKLAKEIVDASKEQGGAYKKREEMGKLAEANRGFSHYRW